MKKEYAKPEVLITSYSQEDIITVSGIKTDTTQSTFDKAIAFNSIDF